LYYKNIQHEQKRVLKRTIYELLCRRVL
jgi:hypothetical protein